MTTAQLLAAVTDALADETAAAVTADSSFETLTVDVPATAWVTAATALRDDPRVDARFFDWLSAYDDVDAGLAVVVRAWSVAARHGLILRTRVGRDGGSLPTLTGVWAGADWHERETWEMFGIEFTGHPHLVPLLLPGGFEGQPLRKEFVLASRVAKPWPGEVEPGNRDADDPGARRRRPPRPPGVPEPGSWGPAS